jgi:hypothetical protein
MYGRQKAAAALLFWMVLSMVEVQNAPLVKTR